MRYPANCYPVNVNKIIPPSVNQILPTKLIEAERLDGGSSWPPPNTRIVGPGSTMKDKRAVEELTGCFMQETPWDFRPFCLSEDLRDVRVLLLLHEQFKTFALGAVGFRRNTYSDGSKGWCLTWAWFHPFIRRQGRLVKLWPALQRRFGNSFLIEPPVSPAMRSVMNQTGHTRRLRALVYRLKKRDKDATSLNIQP